METTIQKKAQSFRLPVELIEKLKKMAKRENRSLNNFVECALLELAYNEPNEDTLDSIREAKEENIITPELQVSIDKARKEFAEGKTVSCKNREELHAFLDSL